jgi:SAM-dependent methyltransferase
MKHTDQSSDRKNTSWQNVGKWYGGLVDTKGHYYHQHVVIPRVLQLLNLSLGSSLLDLACGQGVLARSIPNDIYYVGVDVAGSLIAEAKKLDRAANHKYLLADITKSIPLNRKFTHATIILALQNIAEPQKVIENAAFHLNSGGKLVLVLNHPCFRIPRQSSWEIDSQNKIEYRRINRYLSPLEIPINVHPGQKGSPVVWSFHQPLGFYTWILRDAGFLIECIDEWTSDKESTGSAAKMENLARREFPLFLAIKAVKI